LSISNELKKNLESKSIEELLYIYYNQEEFVCDYTKKYTTNLAELIDETNSIAGK
jgi:hypothetical protein